MDYFSSLNFFHHARGQIFPGHVLEVKCPGVCTCLGVKLSGVTCVGSQMSWSQCARIRGMWPDIPDLSFLTAAFRSPKLH